MTAQSVTSSAAIGLGYPGSQYLKREENGIHSHEKTPRPLIGLCNYPAIFTMTKLAANKLETLPAPSTISIGGMTATGKKVALFSLNSPFLASVADAVRTSATSHLSCFVEPIEYDSSKHIFHTGREDHRALDLESDPVITHITHFVASYGIGFAPKQEFPFTMKNSTNSEERLMLHMDFDPKDAWKLEMHQPAVKA